MRKETARFNLFHITVFQICVVIIYACTVKDVTQQDITSIVDTHNALRKQVSDGVAKGADGLLPAATNMAQMKWNDDLAKLAADWASKCVVKIQRSNGVAGFDSVGQNLYMKSSSAGISVCPYQEAVNYWYNQIANYSITQRQPFQFTSATGAFTQVAWAMTTDVGCACSMDKTKNTDAYIVCDYGPGGNILGGEMYSITS